MGMDRKMKGRERQARSWARFREAGASTLRKLDSSVVTAVAATLEEADRRRVLEVSLMIAGAETDDGIEIDRRRLERKLGLAPAGEGL